jgi:Mg-chelatase subunit ChlD
METGLKRLLGGPAIPLASTAALAAPARRTLVIRIVLAAVLLVAAAVAVRAGRADAEAARGLLPSAGSGMLVLDVSRSIKPETNRTITAVLERLIRSRERVGLVAFSDIAYELLPPGSSSTELRPLLRYFTPPPEHGGSSTTPVNPWSSSFSGGTQISAGLSLAHDALVRAGVRRGPILLVSDLDTAPDDVPRVAQTLVAFRDQGVPFRIVPLSPREDNLTLFQKLAGPQAFGPAVRPVTRGRGAIDSALRGSTPWALLTAATLLLLALAVNEHWCGRLNVPRARA